MSQPIPELTSIASSIDQALERQPEQWQRLHAMPAWEVYTDGSAPIVNPGGAIGFSSIFVLTASGAFEVYGGVPARTSEPPTSNNRAEIAGVIAIMELIYRTHLDKLSLPAEVSIVCDSQYVVNCAQGKWKKHKNRDLWARFDQLASVARAQKVKVSFRWTRAHVGTEWNERADVLAKQGAMSVAGVAALPSLATEAPSKASPPSDYHYLLRLFAVMTAKTKAEGYYHLRTPNRSRSGAVTLANVITLDEAEYHTLNAALTDLLKTLETVDRPPADFKVCVESSRDLMIKQIQGIYGVKSERLIPLHTKTRQLIRQFAGVAWVIADKNDLKTLSQACPQTAPL